MWTYMCRIGFHHTSQTLLELLERGILRDEESDNHGRLIRISSDEFDLDLSVLDDGQWHRQVHELIVS